LPDIPYPSHLFPLWSLPQFDQCLTIFGLQHRSNAKLKIQSNKLDGTVDDGAPTTTVPKTPKAKATPKGARANNKRRVSASDDEDKEGMSAKVHTPKRARVSKKKSPVIEEQEQHSREEKEEDGLEDVKEGNLEESDGV